MAFKTFSDGSVLTASDVNDYLMEQSVISCTSGARPASPNEWMVIGETDTDRKLRWSGAAWEILTEPPQSWNPTITQGSAVSGTVNRGWYRRAYGLFEAQLRWTASAPGTGGNAISISLPVTMADLYDVAGTFRYNDAGSRFYMGIAGPSSTVACVLFAQESDTGAFGVDPAVTVASADELILHITGRY